MDRAGGHSQRPAGIADFGISVALDGDTALIGSPDIYADGRAYIFTKSNGVWSQSQELMSGVCCDDYGVSVALNGTMAFVGADEADIDGITNQGAVYVFTKSNGTWNQTQVLTASDGGAEHGFGAAVAISGTSAIIGAPGVLYQGAPSSAYVFSESGGTWSQSQEFIAPAPNRLGDSAAIDGSTALIGAPYAGYQGMPKKGLVVVLRKLDGSWQSVADLRPSDVSGGNRFGFSVALSGDTALIGSWPGNRAYVFSNSGGSWTETQTLTGQGTDFGEAVAISGSLALVGDSQVNSPPHIGYAYLYAESGGTWNEVQEFTPSDPNGHDTFGYAVALDGTTALAGAMRGGDQTQGTGYFFGQSDLGLALSAPQSVDQGDSFVSQAIATNSSSAASPAVAVTMAVPAAASFVSANASQGSCSEDSGVVNCDFGSIDGNVGTATANVTLKAAGNVGDTIENTASVAKATPALTASAATQIVQSNCADGYTEYDGTLAAGAHTIEPDGQPYQAPAGEENGILTAPAGFRLYAVYQGATGGRHIIPAPGNELHKHAPAGTFAWIVKAGSTGGAFIFCLNHP